MLNNPLRTARKLLIIVNFLSSPYAYLFDCTALSATLFWKNLQLYTLVRIRYDYLIDLHVLHSNLV